MTDHQKREQDRKQKTRKMVLIKGKGTKYEQRIVTDVDQFWSKALGAWVTIPGREEDG